MSLFVLDVSGMRSEACARTVQEAISARDPDAVVVVMRIAGRVSLDTRLSADEAAAVVSGAGYRASFAFAG